MATLHEIAHSLLARRKGLLAADESEGTNGKRFEKLGIPRSAEMRRKWRELLLSADGIEEGLSGVILFDETMRQNTAVCHSRRCSRRKESPSASK